MASQTMFQDTSANNKSSNGFSILEIAVSLVIFGILVVFLSLPIYSGLYLLVDNNNIVRANNLAKSYLNDLESKWKIQVDYDNSELITVGNDYTDNGKYNVAVSSENLVTNDDGIVIVKRVKITYRDKNNKILSEIHYDFTRPGTVLN